MNMTAFQSCHCMQLTKFRLGCFTVHPKKRIIAAKGKPFRRCYITAQVPLPDDTAVDMLSFALSGPGLFASIAFALGALGSLFTFVDMGPRRIQQQKITFLLRIVLSTSRRAEFTNGSVRALRKGENLVKLNTREECSAVTDALQPYAESWDLFRAVGMDMKLIEQFPKDIDANGATWPTDVVDQRDRNDVAARWEEYERLGSEIGSIDKEWKQVLSNLSPLQFVGDRNRDAAANDIDTCKLCGGTGYVRCHRCGGVSANQQKGATFVCDCKAGKRECEWCNSN